MLTPLKCTIPTNSAPPCQPSRTWHLQGIRSDSTKHNKRGRDSVLTGGTCELSKLAAACSSAIDMAGSTVASDIAGLGAARADRRSRTATRVRWVASARDGPSNRRARAVAPRRGAGRRARSRVCWVAAAWDGGTSGRGRSGRALDRCSGRSVVLAASRVVLANTGLQVTGTCYLWRIGGDARLVRVLALVARAGAGRRAASWVSWVAATGDAGGDGHGDGGGEVRVRTGAGMSWVAASRDGGSDRALGVLAVKGQ
jgi:hypothetical protein